MLMYLHWFIWRFGYAPTRKELGAALGISQAGVNRRLHKLARLGQVRVEAGRRGIRMVD